MILTFFNSFKCCETVGCAKGNLLTISPQMHVSTVNKYSIIATLAGCDKALNNDASSFCLSETLQKFEDYFSAISSKLKSKCC